MGKTYCVISHTHWDREWYLPLEEFKLKLVDLIDNLLKILEEYPEYRFHLDAQTIILEDYLSVKPCKRDILKKYISEGRILVGPWYVQNDFNLTSGEATVRNLLIGTSIAEQFGKCTYVGYMADQFGLISQIPQILNKFGIDSAIFGRGYSFNVTKPSEFYWNSEDGSRVISIFMTYWYNNAQRFSKNIDNSLRMLKFIDKNESRVATTDNYLLMNGVDHLEAQEDLLPILDELNKVLPEGEKIIQDTMPQYVERIKRDAKNLQNYTGEMRNGGPNNMLTGTLSSRVYLKQWNVYCQSLLEKKLEPLYSFLNLLGISEYPKEYMIYLWKLLLQNHPHDSICGCSIDVVHEHMIDRFKRIDETAGDLVQRGMTKLINYIDRSTLDENQYILTVFNSSQCTGNYVVEADVDFLSSENVNCFSIRDKNNEEVPFVVLDKKETIKGILSPINLPGRLPITSYRIKLYSENLKSMSYVSYVVTPCKGMLELEQTDNSIRNCMENGYLKVYINNNGTICLYDKQNGRKYDNLLLLEDTEDIGDSYIYYETDGRQTVLSKDVNAKVEVIEKDKLNTTCKIIYSISVPKYYDNETKKRSIDIVQIPVKIVLRLSKGQKYLDVSVTVDNRAEDHRLRVLFPTGIDTDISLSGSAFDVIKRDKGLIRDGYIRAFQQPNTNYVDVDGDGYGVAFFNKGLFEYENLRDDANTIAFTLLRGNSYISHDPYASARMDEKLSVPGNQCKGEHTFELAIYPHSGDYLKSEVVPLSQQFICPPFYGYRPVNVKKFSGGRPFVQGTETPELFYRENEHPDIKLSRENQMFNINKQGLNSMVLSCVKIKDKGKSLIVRLYNVSNACTSFGIGCFKKVKEAYLVNLREQRICQLQVNGNEIKKINAKPKEIITIEIGL